LTYKLQTIRAVEYDSRACAFSPPPVSQQIYIRRIIMPYSRRLIARGSIEYSIRQVKARSFPSPGIATVRIFPKGTKQCRDSPALLSSVRSKLRGYVDSPRRVPEKIWYPSIPHVQLSNRFIQAHKQHQRTHPRHSPTDPRFSRIGRSDVRYIKILWILPCTSTMIPTISKYLDAQLQFLISSYSTQGQRIREVKSSLYGNPNPSLRETNEIHSQVQNLPHLNIHWVYYTHKSDRLRNCISSWCILARTWRHIPGKPATPQIRGDPFLWYHSTMVEALLRFIRATVAMQFTTAETNTQLIRSCRSNGCIWSRYSLKTGGFTLWAKARGMG
jgi:hypothetical protein